MCVYIGEIVTTGGDNSAISQWLFTVLQYIVAFGLVALLTPWLTSSYHKREALKTEINFTNSAIALSYFIMRTYLIIKREYSDPQKQKYDEQKEKYLNKKEYDNNFQSRPLPSLENVNLLAATVFEKLSSNGLILDIMTGLTNSAYEANMCLQENNTAFKEYKEKYPPPHKVPAEILFGPLDTLHEDRINAIHTHISNCVEFARDLMMLLEEHGNKLVKMYRKNAPSVVVPDITELGLPEYDPKFLETVKKRWRSS